MATRMAKHGSIGTFDSAREDWTSYSERLRQYLVVNDIVAAVKKRAILLSSYGMDTHQLIRILVAPKKPTTRMFDQLVELVQRHHNPRPSVIMQRFRFNSCRRKQRQSVSTFVVELRHLTEHCEFGDSMDDMLHDRLVCGINDSRLQRRLLAETSLNFKKRWSWLEHLNRRRKNAQDLQTIGEVGRPVQSFRAKQEDACYRGGGRHLPVDCRSKNVDCHSCGKRGHLHGCVDEDERTKTVRSHATRRTG